LKNSTKVAGFDLDDTWIEPRSGAKFGKDSNDWTWLFDVVPAKLKELHENGYKVVIFTNQGGIKAKGNNHDKSKATMITNKITNIIKALGIPVQVFIAGGEDEYRKPATFMWDLFAKDYNGGIKPDLKESYYVGDAAGRKEGWKADRKKDFACSDRKFASNIGIPFHTPEEFFLGEDVCLDFEWGGLDVATFVTTAESKDADDITDGGVASLTKDHQEMVVFVGFPASGKSTLAQTYMVPKGYVHVNRDTLQTPAKCLKAAQAALAEGKSVVIDNTNPKIDGRSDYIAAAKKAKVPVRCFRFDVSEDLAKHLNYYRERITNGASPHVPRIGYAVYKKNYVEPTLKEGFSEIKVITFVPKFNSDHERAEFDKKAP